MIIGIGVGVCFCTPGAEVFGYCTVSGGSHLNTVPTTTTFGANVTAYQNAFTTFTALGGGALAQPTAELELLVTDGMSSGLSKDTIIRLAYDPLGGTDFSVVIGDFLVGPSATYNVGGSEVRIYLPLAIPTGATLGASASVNNATPGTVRVSYRFCAGVVGTVPQCTAVESVGLTLASSKGTAVTPGNAVEGAWTLLGTLTYSARYCGVGVSVGSTAMASTVYHVDLAYSLPDDGFTAKYMLVENQKMIENSLEGVSFHSQNRLIAFQPVPAGARLYVRASCASAPTAGFTAAAWACR